MTMTFEENSRRGAEQLAKQPPVTLEQAREQTLRIKIRSTLNNLENEVKYNLSIYHPDWTGGQIDVEAIRLIKLYQQPYINGCEKQSI